MEDSQDSGTVTRESGLEERGGSERAVQHVTGSQAVGQDIESDVSGARGCHALQSQLSRGILYIKRATTRGVLVGGTGLTDIRRCRYLQGTASFTCLPPAAID